MRQRFYLKRRTSRLRIVNCWKHVRFELCTELFRLFRMANHAENIEWSCSCFLVFWLGKCFLRRFRLLTNLPTPIWSLSCSTSGFFWPFSASAQSSIYRQNPSLSVQQSTLEKTKSKSYEFADDQYSFLVPASAGVDGLCVKKIERRIKTSQYFTVQRMTFRLYDFIVYVHMARLAISAMCRKKLRLVFLSWEGRKMFYWIFLLLLHRIPREVCRCATQFFNQISTRCSKKACCYGHRWRVKCGPKRIYASNGQQFTAVKYTGRLASVHQFSPSLGHWFKFHFTA